MAYHVTPIERLRKTYYTKDLLHNIHTEVSIGFSGNRYGQMHNNHLSATKNPEAVARELEPNFLLTVTLVLFLHLPSPTLSDRRWALFLKIARCLRNGASLTIYRGPPVTVLTMIFPKNCSLVSTTQLTTQFHNLNSMDKAHK